MVADVIHDAGVALEAAAILFIIWSQLEDLFVERTSHPPKYRLVRDGEGPHVATLDAVVNVGGALAQMQAQYEERARALLSGTVEPKKGSAKTRVGSEQAAPLPTFSAIRTAK